MRSLKHFRAGVTLIELVVAIALVGVLVIVFASALAGFRLLNETKNRYRATALSETALDALRALPSASIADQADMPFLGVLVNAGNFEVSTSPGAPSAPNILHEFRSSPPSLNVSGLLLLTPRVAATTTIEAKLQWAPDLSATGTPRVGMMLRGVDLAHGYFYTIDPNSIQFELRNGAKTTALFSTAGSYASSTWYTLKASVDGGGNFSLYLNGLQISTVTDTTFATGEVALIGESALINADDIILSGDTSGSWNFDGDPIGALPGTLRRNGFGDLPKGRGTLTISDAFAGNSTLKKATVRVYWEGKQEEKKLETSTFINK
jgi:prepilin-type N-terminal cleavage/methylation domain-containing protein